MAFLIWNFGEFLIHENNECKEKFRNESFIRKKLKSVETVVVFAPISTSVTLPLKTFALVVVPKSFGAACGLTISNTKLSEVVIYIYI